MPSLQLINRTVGVLIVDEHPVVRDGIAVQLGGSRAVEITGFAGSAAEARAAAAETEPDVILMDVRLRDQIAPELVRDLMRVVPGARVIVFTAHPGHAAVQAALTAGAHGVISRSVRREDLVRAVLSVARGEQLPSPGAEQEGGLITPREYQVLCKLAIGRNNREIAEEMLISRNTVKGYLQNTLQKLGARNRVEAIVRARELGLL